MLRGFSKTILRLCLAVALGITLFGTPLLIRYRYFKEYSLSMTSSDTMSVNKRMSSTWCDAQSLTMNSPFNAYLLTSQPPMSSIKRKYKFDEHFVLPSGSTEVWGFYLMEKSVLTLSVCYKLPGAAVTVIKGKDLLMSCMEYHVLHLNDDVSIESGESSETAEDIDDKMETHESTVSSSEGVFSNETEGHEFDCHGALLREEYKKLSACFRSHNLVNSTPSYDDRMKVTASTSDRYYFVFSSSHVELDEIRQPISNEIYAHFELDRVTFNLSTTYQTCTNNTRCTFEVPWANKGFVVVEYDSHNETINQGTLSSDVLISFCQPRKWLYFSFYLLFFLLIFVCAFQ